MTTGLLEADQVAGTVDNIEPSDMNYLEERIKNMSPGNLFKAWKMVSGLNNIDHPNAHILRERLVEEINRRSQEADSSITDIGDF